MNHDIVILAPGVGPYTYIGTSRESSDKGNSCSHRMHLHCTQDTHSHTHKHFISNYRNVSNVTVNNFWFRFCVYFIFFLLIIHFINLTFICFSIDVKSAKKNSQKECNFFLYSLASVTV